MIGNVIKFPFSKLIDFIRRSGIQTPVSSFAAIFAASSGREQFNPEACQHWIIADRPPESRRVDKEGNARIEALLDAFTVSFKIGREELLDRLCNWSHDLLSFYESLDEFGTPTSIEIRKRGRPKKLAYPK